MSALAFTVLVSLGYQLQSFLLVDGGSENTVEAKTEESSTGGLIGSDSLTASERNLSAAFEEHGKMKKDDDHHIYNNRDNDEVDMQMILPIKMISMLYWRR